jgi:hypothetical protein
MDWKGSFTRDVTLNFYGQHFVGMVEDNDVMTPKELFNEVVLLHERFTEK